MCWRSLFLPCNKFGKYFRCHVMSCTSGKMSCACLAELFCSPCDQHCLSTRALPFRFILNQWNHLCLLVNKAKMWWLGSELSRTILRIRDLFCRRQAIAYIILLLVGNARVWWDSEYVSWGYRRPGHTGGIQDAVACPIRVSSLGDQGTDRITSAVQRKGRMRAHTWLVQNPCCTECRGTIWKLALAAMGFGVEAALSSGGCQGRP